MRGKTSLLRGWLSGAVYVQRKRIPARILKRKRSERSLPQRPCVVGQQVWSAKPEFNRAAVPAPMCLPHG